MSRSSCVCLGDAPSVGCWRTPLESEADTACWHPPLTVGGCYTCQSSGEWAWHSGQLCWSADCGTTSVCVVSLGTPYHLNKKKRELKMDANIKEYQVWYVTIEFMSNIHVYLNYWWYESCLIVCFIFVPLKKFSLKYGDVIFRKFLS